MGWAWASVRSLTGQRRPPATSCRAVSGKPGRPVTFYDPPLPLRKQRRGLRKKALDYFVEIQKPLQVQLFYDPGSCKVVVHRIFSTCKKSEALLLQPGDSLILAGDVTANGTYWGTASLSQLLRVLMDSDNQSLGCVFRRPERPPGERQGYTWYSSGVVGATSTQGGSLGMLGDHSVLVVPQRDNTRGSGKQMRVSFHHFTHGERRFQRKMARPQAWRRALQSCISVPPLVMQPATLPEPAPMPSGWGIRDRGTSPKPQPLTTRVVLPWLLVVQGTLKEGALSTVCAEFGLSTIDIVRLSADHRLRPRLKGASRTRSPLDAFVDAVCGMHAAAIRGGLMPQALQGGPARTPGADSDSDPYSSPHFPAGSRSVSGEAGMWVRKRGYGVAVLAPARAPKAAATVIAACMHWLGGLPLGESVALASERCCSEADEGLIRAATKKLAREITFRPRPLELTWPYGGSDDVMLLVHTRSHRPSQPGDRLLTRAPPRGWTPGRRNQRKKRRLQATQLAAVVTVPGRGQGSNGAAGASASASVANGNGRAPRNANGHGHTNGHGGSSGGNGSRKVKGGLAGNAGNAGAGEGFLQVAMSRSDNGLYTAKLLVRPHRTRRQVRYSFRVRGLRGVDPAQPIAKAEDGQLMNVATVAGLHLPEALEVQVARVEAARRVMRMRRNTTLPP